MAANNTDIVALKAAIDKLVDGFTAFQVKTGENYGATAAELRHIQESLKALDGLFSRVSVAEKDIALLKEQHTNFVNNVLSWKKDSEEDREGIHREVEPLKEFRWILLGGFVAAQVFMGLFGPSLRALFGLP